MQTSEPFVLTAEQIATFEQDGLLKVDFNLDSKLLATIVEKTISLYDQEKLKAKLPGVRIQDGWRTIEEIRQLAMNRTILDSLEQIFGRKAKPFQTLNFPVGTEQLPHSDTLHFNSIPRGYMVGVWIALEDIDESNGPLIYYPGSHKLREYTMRSFGLGRGHDFYSQYEKEILRIIEQQKFEPALGIVKKGEAIIWHANLLHGGAPQKDPERTRHSQVTHCYFENCKYWTPMYSRFPLKQYREPVWIPDSPDFVLPERAYLEPTPWPIRLRKHILSELSKLNPFRKK